jgi:hypothetical protein
MGSMKHWIFASALAAAASAHAAVDFNQVAITQPLTLADVQSAAGQTSTSAIDGVALGPGQNIFLVHVNSDAHETLVGINPFTQNVFFTKTHTAIKSDLGTTWSAGANFPILVGEFVWAPTLGPGGSLILADNSEANPDGDYSLFRVNVGTGTASPLLFGTEIAGWNSHGVLPTGQIVGTLGEDYNTFTGGEPKFGLVDPNAPAFDTLFDEDDLKNAVIPPLNPSDEVPPETIGVHPVTGQIFVFGHDTLHLFRVDNATTVPTLTWLNIPGWTGVVDLHGLAVDEDGNLYGFDEANEAIVIYNGTSSFSVSIAAIGTAIGSDFEPALWRGLKARKISSTQSEVWLSDGSGNSGVVRIVFGSPAAGVNDWALYD